MNNFSFLNTEFLGSVFFSKYKKASQRSIVSRWRNAKKSPAEKNALYFLCTIEFAENLGIRAIYKHDENVSIVTDEITFKFIFLNRKEQTLFGEREIRDNLKMLTILVDSIDMHEHLKGAEKIDLETLKDYIKKYVCLEAAHPTDIIKVSSETARATEPEQPEQPQPEQLQPEQPKLSKTELLQINSKFVKLRKSQIKDWDKTKCTCDRRKVLNKDYLGCDYCGSQIYPFWGS